MNPMPGRRGRLCNAASFAPGSLFAPRPHLKTHRFFPLSRDGSIDITDWTHLLKTGIGYGVSVSRDHPARLCVDLTRVLRTAHQVQKG